MQKKPTINESAVELRKYNNQIELNPISRINKSQWKKNLEAKLIKWLNWFDKSRLIGVIRSVDISFRCRLEFYGAVSAFQSILSLSLRVDSILEVTTLFTRSFFFRSHLMIWKQPDLFMYTLSMKESIFTQTVFAGTAWIKSVWLSYISLFEYIVDWWEKPNLCISLQYSFA